MKRGSGLPGPSAVPSRALAALARLLAAALGLAAWQAAASEADAAQMRTPHVQVALRAEQAAMVPGAQAWVGIDFRIKPGWHIYWLNPGDSGYPPSIAWQLPAGVKAGDIRWPAPERLPFGPLTNFGYHGEVLLALPVSLPDAYRETTVALRATVNWLVCEENCIPESANLALTLPVADAARADPAEAARFTAARGRWPAAAAPAGWQLEAHGRAGDVQLRLVAPPGQAPAALSFFPYAEGLMHAAAEQTLRTDGGRQVLDLRRADVPLAPWHRLQGVVVASAAGGGDASRPPVAFAVDLPIAGAAATPHAASAGVAGTGSSARVPLLLTLALALAGGALLNLMPCVFPVLSIKLLGLMRHEHGNGAPLRRHALFYSLGVILSFVALAALLLALRGAGHALGWGFQLQSPAVVGTLALLFFALGLSLSGALPIATLAQDVPGAWRLRHPQFDALASGGLAVLVASPCTAPFMGAALGAALTLPPAPTLLVFAALGIGMALPFALLLLCPRLQARLPRPGPWMERIKQFLALPLYATVVWLGWVLAEQIGPSAMLSLGGGLVSIVAMAWCLHLRKDALRVAGAGLALVSALAMALWPWLQVSLASGTGSTRPGGAGAAGAEAWQAWSPEAVAAAQAAQTPVFVDFTAAWCVTCQVNKRLVLDSDEVRAEFAAAGVLLMRADWTRHDPAITAELGRLGRGGVPVYALYPPQGEPLLLPEVLTRTSVAEALRALTPGPLSSTSPTPPA